MMFPFTKVGNPRRDTVGKWIKKMSLIWKCCVWSALNYQSQVVKHLKFIWKIWNEIINLWVICMKKIFLGFKFLFIMLLLPFWIWRSFYFTEKMVKFESLMFCPPPSSPQLLLLLLSLPFLLLNHHLFTLHHLDQHLRLSLFFYFF